MRDFLPILFLLFASIACVPNKSEISVSMNKKSNSTLLQASISSVQIVNNQLVIEGSGLSGVTDVKVGGTAFNENFSIESKTATKIIANSVRAFSFDVSKIFNLIISNANASATFPIDFSLCNATLNGKGFNCAAPVADKDVLSYDAVSGTWKPRPASGLNYLGTFDASSNPGVGPAIQPTGAYYIISDDGTIATVSFAVGDWLVSNGSAWQKIDNSSAVLSVYGRHGTITAQHGDYTLDLLGDVSFPTAPVAGKVLKFDGVNWVAGDDLSGGGAGSVTTSSIAAGAVTDAKIDTVSASKITGTITSAQIADGTIVNADINTAAAIDYSKLNIPDGAIPAIKISGLPSAGFTALTGDVTATGTGSVAATVAQVGGVTAANIAAGVNLANAATNSNTANTIVKRDGSGNFTATNVSGTVAVANGGTGATTLGLNQLLFGNGTSAVGTLATTTVPSVLLSTVTTGAPAWTTSTAGNVLKGSVTGVTFGPLDVTDLPAGILSGAGTANYIPVYDTTDTLKNSPIMLSGNNVGIGTTAPDTTVVISSTQPNGTPQPSRAGLIIEGEGTTFGGRIATRVYSATEAPYFIGYRALGTKAAPTALTSGKAIVNLIGYGFDGTNWSSNSSSPGISLETSQVWTGTNKGSRISFGTVANNTAVTVERMLIDHNGNVGIGTTPGSTLDVKGTLRLSGATSGYVGFAPAAAAGSTTYTLPVNQGTAGQVLSTDGVATNATLSWVTPSGGGVTALTGDVTASGSGSVAATVAQVGGVTAANIAAGANLANAATTSNTANTIVKRDGSGNFTATNVSGTVAVANGGTGATTLGVNQLLFGNGTSAIGTLPTTATPSVLLSAITTGAPTWTTSTAGNFLKGSVTGVLFGPITTGDLPSGTLTGSGTVNYIPYYSAAAVLGNSPIAVSGSNVSVGSTTPGSNTKLNVEGQIRSKSFSLTTGAVDWVGGNSGTTTFDCGSNITFANLRDGGSYTLAVTGTGTTQCTFSTTTTGDDAGTVSYRFIPANAVRTASSHTIYSLQRIGTVVYVSWITGF